MNLRSRLLPLSLLPAVFLLEGCGEAGQADPAAKSPSNEVPTNVRILTADRTDLDETLTISGPLVPIQATDVSSEESGVVKSIPRDKGAEVGQGGTLVLLDRDVLEAEKRAAEASRDLAAYNDERAKKLFEAKQISREEMIRSETTLAEAKARADVARTRWERAAIKAPFAGIVADRYVEPGQLVAMGSRVARVVDPYTLKVKAFVSEREVAWIRAGAPAWVLPEGSSKALEGSVHWVGVEANPTNGKFPVEVSIDNAALDLRPGVVARARILKRTHPGVIVVPRDAILLRPEGPSVFVVEDDRATTRDVQLGPDEGLMAIVASGVNPGDRVIVRGQRDVRDGSLVRVTEEATALDGSRETDPAEIRARAAEDRIAPVGAEKAR